MDLNAVVGGARRLLGQTLGDNVELVCRLDRSLDHVVVDPGQIEQVLVNLAVNARDAMPGGGKLVIETGNLDVDEVYASTRANLSAGRYAALKVSDSGTGMTPRSSSGRLSPSSPPSPVGRARDSAWRPCTASSPRPGEAPGSTRNPRTAPRSSCCCR